MIDVNEIFLGRSAFRKLAATPEAARLMADNFIPLLREIADADETLDAALRDKARDLLRRWDDR